MRFLAAAIVALGHSRELVFVKYAALSSHSIMTTIFFVITKMGNESVLIFFVLSGFLVGGKALQRIGDGTFKIQDYAIDRLTRIYIPLIPAIILTVVVEIILHSPVTFSQVACNIFALQDVACPYLENNGVLWTLSYEIWFYIAIAGVALAANKKITGWAILALVGVVFIRLFPIYLVCWLLGAAAFMRLPKKISYRVIFAAIILCAYGCLGRQVMNGSDSYSVEFLKNYVPSEDSARVIFSAGMALLIRHLILIKSLPGLERIGTYLAAFSYSLYLTHFPVVMFFKYQAGVSYFIDINAHTLTVYMGVCASCLIVALVMYYLFERNTRYLRCAMKTK